MAERVRHDRKYDTGLIPGVEMRTMLYPVLDCPRERKSMR